jgi:molybdopterin-guanine dinucleotide biosynthesis protein A
MLSHMSGSERSRMGFILAGGKSSRMGISTDKAFLDFRGQSLLERALAVAGTVCDRVTIVGDPAKFEAVLSSQFSVLSKTERQSLRTENRELRTVIADIFPGCGPLAGIHAALVHSTAELNLMLAVDMPFVSGELLAFVFAAAEASDTVIVTVPRTSRGFQPLCAVYRRDFSTVAEQALRAGKYKVDAAFSGMPVRVIEENELAAAGFSERDFFNVNTPQDRQAAEGGLKPT